MKAILFTQTRQATDHLYPFTLTRKVQDIRIGILTLREKWELVLGAETFEQTDFLTEPFYYINSAVLPDEKFASRVKQLKVGEALSAADDNILAALITSNHINNRTKKIKPEKTFTVENVKLIEYPWHIFELNKYALAFDFALLTKSRKSAPVDKTNSVSGKENIFIAKGAMVKHCIINAEEGPVYIGKNALVMEGSCLRGPVSIGDGAVVKMGAKIYGATTIGPGCIVGGEIKNSVLFANSNKAHDGYLGDSVIGEWCNLGAGTSNSNLKNTAGNIDVHLRSKKITAGIKCGVMMGDFSRTAINTAINTGTVIGVSANVFGNGFTPKHIPSFSWGFTKPVKYKLDKALQDAERWKALKGQDLSEAEESILKNIYKTS